MAYTVTEACMECPSQSRQALQEPSLIFFYFVAPCTRGARAPCMGPTCMHGTKAAAGCSLQLVLQLQGRRS